MSDHIPDPTKMISDTPISDSTPHNVAELGMLCRRFERELNEANSIIRQQQLLDEENLRLKERIKLLEEAGDLLTRMVCRQDGYGIYQDEEDAVNSWHKAKEAKP
jgi:hypothetical protein